MHAKLYMKIPALVFTLTFLTASCAHAMDVEAAYAAIPHQRTVFDAGKSALTTTQAASLKQLLTWSDKAMVLRVESWQAYKAGNLVELKRLLSGYKAVIDAGNTMSTLPELKPVQGLILQAIQGQQAYLEKKLLEKQGSSKADNAFTPEVQQASQKLQQAYGLLMQRYPNETRQNKQAFYDYLCALDFL